MDHFRVARRPPDSQRQHCGIRLSIHRIEAAKHQSSAAAHGELSKAPDFLPSPELKRLYREVVNQIQLTIGESICL
jgi:hypothetical protein